MRLQEDTFSKRFLKPRRDLLRVLEKEILLDLRSNASANLLPISAKYRVKGESSALKKEYGGRDVLHDLLGLRIISPHPKLFDCIERTVIRVAKNNGFLLFEREDLYSKNARFGYRAIHHDYLASEEVGHRIHAQAGLEVQITTLAWSIVGDLSHQLTYKRKGEGSAEAGLIFRLGVAADEIDDVITQLSATRR